jgi:Flp pilus assembly CpaE family ATPase
LNVSPSYSALDALVNLHRLDETLLESLVTTATNGLHLLGGPEQPTEVKATNAELAQLFNLLEAQYRYVVVDCSGRFDAMSRLLADLSNRILMVAQNDLVSLWSAGRIHEILQQGNLRVGLVVNRYRKISGFGGRDIEKATGCDLLWKLPSDYASVIEAIDKGVPVVTQAKKEIGRSFRALAELLIVDGHGGEPGGSSPPLVPAPIPGGPGLRPVALRRAAWES